MTLVVYTPGGSVVWANPLPLVDGETMIDSSEELKSLIGTDASIVSALVSVVIDSTESVLLLDYATYELYANSVLQPGGGS